MPRTIFANCRLLDGNRAARRATVAVEDGLIATIADGDAGIAAGPDDRVVDLRGRTMMPGMILGHYHAAYWDLGAWQVPLGLESPAPLMAVRAAANLRLAIDSGFTGVISAGAPHAIDASMKMAIAEGTIVGPRIMAGSRDISSTGHSADLSFPSWWQIGAKGAVNLSDGPEQFRRATRQEIKDGAEIIKLFATDGHATGGTGSQPSISRDEFAMAVQTAHERNVKVRAHIANKDSVLLALDLRIHIIDHGDWFDDECIDRILQQETYLAPSLYFPKVMMTTARPSEYTELMKAPYAAMAEILPRANAAGVKLLIGDDYGAMGFAHGRYAEELALYVNEIGIPALDVIRWATKHGAEAMRQGDTTGTLEVGKFADLLVIDGDPVADITILQDRARLLAIFKQGQPIKDELYRIESGDGFDLGLDAGELALQN